MYDLIIIGAGPAGLTAALYALRANKKVLILESKIHGGQIINASKIENYPGIETISGFDYVTILYNQVISLNAEIKYEEVKKLNEDKTVITNNDAYKAKAIIIATGLEYRKLGLENEEKYIGKGISYCATCDGNFFKNKTVAIVGGGNTALTEAIYLSDIVEKVYVIHRRDTFRGENKYLNELKKLDNIEFVLNSKVTKLNGNDYLESVELEGKDDKTELKLDGLFIAIGHIPQNSAFKDIIDLDENGYVKSMGNDGVHTNIKGIYVAGDTRVKELRQLVTATSDGAISAMTAISEMN